MIGNIRLHKMYVDKCRTCIFFYRYSYKDNRNEFDIKILIFINRLI